MKIYYIGVFGPRQHISRANTDAYEQILKNEEKPATELAVEKDLSAYSRFTRNKSVFPEFTSSLPPGSG
jgi:hypothetical protein